MSRIQLDYTNAMAEVVGPEHGLTEEELASLGEGAGLALEAVRARRETDLRWLDLPHRPEMLEPILEFDSEVRGRFENLVVLGIGGSALGTIALRNALASRLPELGPSEGRPRLTVLDNVDPDLVGEVLDAFDPTRTLFNVISKSGGTAETMSQFLIVRERLIERLGAEGHRANVVVTTDPEKGTMREIVRREGYRSFPVPEGVGGRFSVLSPVGLLPLALCGIDVGELLEGARAMDEACRAPSLGENPALTYAALQWAMQAKKNKPMSVSFAYAHRLASLVDWYAQLLSESIGKRLSRSGEEVFTGPTPVRAVGVTDQHSQVQLYVEGPHDKWFTLLAVERPARSVPIPSAYSDLDAVAYLGGRDLTELFHAERDGTRIALTEAGRPNATLRFDEVSPHTAGQYVFLMELAVALMGEYYDINAFDQRGVEAGKEAACALMGCAGYEARREEIEAAGRRQPRVV